ncbi:MAG TPA: 23S rRNA (adenine(2030)-N(6))-methyltransferase RlmJ [Woeseiaceae bacterium]|nr:23S rRNA (adenine(2030)-N(6))-methyltransferase RlmJ [Woeseiaceae bacterium]
MQALMLSYRHSFHAGNFADVVKHVVLVALLRYMTRKEAPFCYIDTHAGAGGYDLRGEHARKTAESEAGIGRISSATDAPAPVARYLDIVRRYAATAGQFGYPGSPWIAAELMRRQDRLMLCELHGSDFPQLRQMFRPDRRVHCYAEDGYRFSIGLVPPAERRGLILMDPSYELKNEYSVAVTTLGRLHRRFATGVYALWYPLLAGRDSAMLKRSIDRLGIRDMLNLELVIADRNADVGMYGCGMILVNPPWTLRNDMELALPYLAEKLGRNIDSSYRIELWSAE